MYEDYLRQEDPNAFTEKGFVQSYDVNLSRLEAFTDEGVIQTYDVDLTSLEYNPMGGLMVTILLNKRKDLYISYNLIDNGDDTYYSAYFVGSPNLLNVIGKGEE